MKMDYDEAIKKEAAYFNKLFLKNYDVMDLHLSKRGKNPYFYWEDPNLEKIFVGKYLNRILYPFSKNSLKILECGCGLGRFSLELCRQNHHIDAYDISDNAIKHANQYYQILKKKSNNFGTINYQVRDLNKIILPKDIYDLVISHGTMHHILNSKRLIKETYKSLKRGGKFLLLENVGQKSRLVNIFNTGIGILFFFLKPLKIYYKFLEIMKLIEPNKLIKKSYKKSFPLSPFEGATGREMCNYFIEIFGKENVMIETANAFAHNWVVRIPGPSFIRYPIARLIKRIDNFLIKIGFVEGGSVFIEATKS